MPIFSKNLRAKPIRMAEFGNSKNGGAKPKEMAEFDLSKNDRAIDI